MASISSVGGSSGLSGLYNSANIISGLASGMDTEGMIESLVQSYQNKIQTLNNKATKLQWKQESYRNIISKMTGFASKYTSYTSSTNLLSASFFSSAVKVAAQGKNGEKVTASGRTDSNVVLNGVSQLATAARYATSGAGLKADGGKAITADKEMRFDEDVRLSTLGGSLAFNYGNKSVSISFDEVKDQIPDVDDAGRPLSAKEKVQRLSEMIQEKLGEQKITLSSGETVTADERIGVKVDGQGGISFYDKSKAGNEVYIAAASESIRNTLGLGDLTDKDNRVDSFTVAEGVHFTKDVKAYEYLSGKSFNINVDGTTKTVQMPRIELLDDGRFKLTELSTVKDAYGNVSYTYDPDKLDKNKYTITKRGETRTVNSVEDVAGAYTEMLQSGVKKAFGDKLQVSNEGTNGRLSLKFEVNEGSNLLINTSVGEALGIGQTATNYLNTGSSLKDLMTEEALKSLEPAKDEKGEPMLDKDGEQLYDFKINGELIGRYTKDAKLSDIMNDINANTEAGVKVSYSRTTRQFVFNSRKTGSENGIDIEKGGLAAAIFGSTEISEKSKGTFGQAYGVDSYLDGKTKVSFDFDGFHTDLGISADASIEDVAKQLNSKISHDGFTAGYNKYTGQLEITDKSGAKVDLKMQIDDPDMGAVQLKFNKEEFAPGVSYTPGQDAKFKVTVDGVEKELVRGTNSVDIDGLTINFNETFNETYKADSSENVSFKINTDADKIVDAVKSMVNDYNEMMSELRSAYATMPYKDSTGAFKDYEPLTEAQKSGMSQNEIDNYEAKAKQGILFGDSNLRALYERMRDVFQPSGADAALLSKIGISTSFSSIDNSASVTVDEQKLRAALESNPDEVMSVFTKTGENGGSNGIMQGLKTQLDRYAGLTGATKGILVQQAGTPLNSLSLLDNQWQKQIDTLGTEIEKWQDKLEKQVDRYTSMFSKLEVLINQMNSQSSTLAGLMSGQ